MDITDISKVASRKRMNTDAEKLREKVSRETAKIIKLKVAQDTAYWDLKERLQQLQAAHERLQQNMVDVQMQHEAASAQYARELRLRPDALNRAAATRGVCSALQEFGERLRRGVARARDDRAALQRAFEQCGAELQRRRRRRRTQVALLKQSVARLHEEAGAARADAERERRERDARDLELRRLHLLLTEANNTINVMKAEEVTHVDEIKNLKQIVDEKKQNEEMQEAEISRMKQHACQLEAEKLEAIEQLQKSVQECAAKDEAIAELTAGGERLRAELQAHRAEHELQRDADAAELSRRAALADERARDLRAAADTIARLMADLKSGSDARARADAALAAARDALQAKEEELGAQMTIILDMRSEKERLQERIQGMQSTIDNIQKELTGRIPAAKGGEPPELDGAPRRAEDATLYSFLSDGSAEGDALDPREVGRRFEALAGGEAARALRGFRHRTPQGSISLSQVKDDLKIKNRTFFKNKRFDSKSKKFK